MLDCLSRFKNTAVAATLENVTCTHVDFSQYAHSCTQTLLNRIAVYLAAVSMFGNVFN